MSMDSCDTFVALKDVTASGCVIFGKNSDRPLGEVQEVVRVGAQNYQPGETLQCTYIKIPQVSHTFDVILSKPAWLWGAEMGANEHGVAIGNEAVWNRLSDPEYDSVPRLLGMDLLRLGLERGRTAKEAMDVITHLLEEFGQGGPCSDIAPEHTYHNSFLIADPQEAWVLETARSFWVAERITSGTRNISNCMSIGTRIDLMSENLLETAKQENWWNGQDDDFHWAQVIGEAKHLPSTKLANPRERFCAGKTLLASLSAEGQFKPESMLQVLRDTESNICRHYYSENRAGNPTTGSLVCQLSVAAKERVFWLTATPDPSISVYKPFRFSEADFDLELTASPASFPNSVKTPTERSHQLWRAHRDINLASCSIDRSELAQARNELENEWITSGSSGTISSFTQSSQREMDLYQGMMIMKQNNDD